ncbi:MAG: transcription/translation regulatory transformer protein RfaH [Pseudomonadales bacterium]
MTSQLKPKASAQWYAVQTKPRQEAVAQKHLHRQGYTIYLPMLQQRKLKQDRWHNVIEPLFPRYLFIYADLTTDNLAPVRSTQGVSSMVKFGHLMHPIPDAVINWLKGAESGDTGLHKVDEEPLQQGDEVEILAGPFAGLTAIYQLSAAQDRAMLLLNLLGRQAEVEMHRDEYTAR